MVLLMRNEEADASDQRGCYGEHEGDDQQDVCGRGVGGRVFDHGRQL